MTYAYIQASTVLMVERRTENGYSLNQLYHGSLLPYFKPVPDELADSIRVGWLYTEEAGFYEPQAGDVNPETGKVYLPDSVDLQEIYRLQSENAALQESNTQLQAQIKAAVASNAFLEECIVEMAGVVYA